MFRIRICVVKWEHIITYLTWSGRTSKVFLQHFFRIYLRYEETAGVNWQSLEERIFCLGHQHVFYEDEEHLEFEKMTQVKWDKEVDSGLGKVFRTILCLWDSRSRGIIHRIGFPKYHTLWRVKLLVSSHLLFYLAPKKYIYIHIWIKKENYKVAEHVQMENFLIFLFSLWQAQWLSGV